MMKRIGILCAVLIAAAAAANSTESVELLRSGAQHSFERLAPVRLRPKATRTVHLTGHVSLDGTSYVGDPPNNSAMVTFHGTGTLHDSSGATATVHFSTTQTFFINGNYTTGYVYPREYVQVYSHGRPVGMVMVSGTIYVSGWVNGGWVRLSGSGQVSGSGSVQE